jgi:hypothetical protein
LRRDAPPGSPSAPGLDHAYEEVALCALASVDAEQAREFVKAELGPLTAADDDTARLSTTVRVYLKENMSPLRARSDSAYTRTRSRTASAPRRSRLRIRSSTACASFRWRRG